MPARAGASRRSTGVGQQRREIPPRKVPRRGQRILDRERVGCDTVDAAHDGAHRAPVDRVSGRDEPFPTGDDEVVHRHHIRAGGTRDRNTDRAERLVQFERRLAGADGRDTRRTTGPASKIAFMPSRSTTGRSSPQCRAATCAAVSARSRSPSGWSTKALVIPTAFRPVADVPSCASRSRARSRPVPRRRRPGRPGRRGRRATPADLRAWRGARLRGGERPGDLHARRR